MIDSCIAQPLQDRDWGCPAVGFAHLQWWVGFHADIAAGDWVGIPPELCEVRYPKPRDVRDQNCAKTVIKIAF